MQNKRLNLYTFSRLLLTSFSISLVLAPLTAIADTSYDMSSGQAQEQFSGGTGIGQSNGKTGPNVGNSNVSFSDFGYSADNNNARSSDMGQAADLLPINHLSTVTTNTGTQLPINSYASSQVKPNTYGGGISGTSPTQAPQIIPGQSTLPPVSSALQATIMPNAFVPITSGNSNDFSHYNSGFNTTPYNLYQGPYGQPIPLPGPVGTSAILGNSNALPPTSMGSVDFNITTK